MPKEGKRKAAEPKRERPGEPGAHALVSRRSSVVSFFKATALLLFVAAFFLGYQRTRAHVEKNLAFGRIPPTVLLKDRPAWMSDLLAKKIVAVARPDVAYSAFDHNLLVNTTQLLRSHPDSAPWIRQVKSVRRGYDKGPGDVLEIDCEFRAPIAAVKAGDYYWYIDGECVMLPEQFNAAEVRRVLYDPSHRPSIRIIEGVAAAPPEAGQKWKGEDLAAGVELVKLLYGKPYTDEVERVNVANFAGRVDPNEAQLVLITRYQTQVRWGRPVNAAASNGHYVVDVSEVSPDQKLQYMEQIVRQFGRIDANHSAVDVRFDWVTVPSAGASGGTVANQYNQ
jgi:hypothetical protein